MIRWWWQTPRSLVNAGLYGTIAIEWRQGVHHAVSVRLVANALGAQMGRSWTECVLDGGRKMLRSMSFKPAPAPGARRKLEDIGDGPALPELEMTAGAPADSI